MPSKAEDYLDEIYKFLDPEPDYYISKILEFAREDHKETLLNKAQSES